MEPGILGTYGLYIWKLTSLEDMTIVQKKTTKASQNRVEYYSGVRWDRAKGARFVI